MHGEDHVTLQRRCRLSLSLCSLCHISCNPVSKFLTTLHWTHHECFGRKRRSEKRDWAIANKKKFKDSTISGENLDDAIANGVKLALKEQQSTLNSVVASAVRDAVDSVLIPALRELREDIQATDKSVKELREELEAIATTAKQTRDRVDSVQADACEDGRTVTDLRN